MRQDVTEGYLVRHFQGRGGGRDPALIDIAQDRALQLLNESGVFELGVTLKGGTAIRKFRAGNAGRFSTDFDFAGADRAAAEAILTQTVYVKAGEEVECDTIAELPVFLRSRCTGARLLRTSPVPEPRFRSGL